jgi:outer membrane receptor protein involved in Fe transport
MLVALLLVEALAPRALAQQEQQAQAQQTQGPQQQRTGGIEAITVTAQRREQLLQETPVAVTAFSAGDLEALSINSSQQIAAFTPGLVISKASNSNGLMALFGRGVGQADNNPMVDNKVGLYIDGAYSANGIASMFDLIDIERVEVLRGPQGTLFGRNTIGGSINIISKKPTNEFGFRIKGILGENNQREVRGTVNFPGGSRKGPGAAVLHARAARRLLQERGAGLAGSRLRLPAPGLLRGRLRVRRNLTQGSGRPCMNVPDLLASASTARRSGGLEASSTGLGCSICRSVVPRWSIPKACCAPATACA